ncbi:helix-turn-helix domain-containing protein [Streptococcus pseudopneumoniae]|uniref:helix-turn-helix domain-containing protein n=1 Tax=Streptococcus pseudopneumoniae TaxID=257758 RepID=UPI001C6566AF|nr:helix-turn-helix transcriptional regulator [Streptococcus pseudopneumoniae]MBW8142312.1 helix-turn-helix transcriptional regulator [Streptococcus pseudopneumoniae]
MEKFHEKLKMLRKKEGLTQQEVAELVHVERGVYTNWELGNRNPNYENLSMLVCIFDVSLDYLLGDYLEISKERYLKLKKQKEEKKNLFSVRLKELRLRHGFNQEELAKQIGIKQNSYSDWEHGKCKPNYEKLEKIADFFGVSLDWLFGRE